MIDSAHQATTRAAAAIDHDLSLTAIFEERAENLNEDELNKWSAETDRDRALLVKLKGSGAKLLSGPRGSGKSTLLRKAYFALLRGRPSASSLCEFLPLFSSLVVVSFKR